MYGFSPTEEQKMLIDTIGRFVKGDLRPKAHEAEENRILPLSLINKGWELGVLQASIPGAYGGFGERSAITGVLAAEELAFGDLAGSFAVMLPALFVTPILLCGTEEQKRENVTPVVAGGWMPYTAALIEPCFDFDPNSLKTTAEIIGDDYVLNGIKTCVPYAHEAEGMIVYASLGGQTQGFIIPRDSKGMSVSTEKQKLMGINALPLYDVKLEGVHVKKSNRLGGNNGHEFAPILAALRIANAALSVGVARSAFEYARDYAKEREAFGVKIAQKQAIAFMLAEMATEIEAIRLLTWEAAWKLDTAKEDAPVSAFLASTGAADMVMMVTDRAVQILGGYGYIREYPVEMWMRNGRGFTTFTGLAIV